MTSTQAPTNQTDLFRRPHDSHFDSMQELLRVAQSEMEQSREMRVPSSDILFDYNEDGEALRINLGSGQPALPLTHYSLTQVAGMARIPVQIIERLYHKGERELVVDNLNALFPTGDSDVKMALIRDYRDESDQVVASQVRAVNGSAYSRLWDCEVFQEIDDFLIPRGFTPKIPNLHSNAMRNQLMHGITAGLFRGDQTSFGFFFASNPDETLAHELGGLVPGMMVWNSEVGARSFGFHTFYYHKRSGSIIIWTPANHKRKRFVHRGNIQNGFKEYLDVLEDTADNFAERLTEDIEIFKTAATTPFAIDENAAIQKLNDSFDIPQPDAEQIVRASNYPQNSFGDPLSVFRIALGIVWEAGQTGRAESLVDKSLVATKLMRKLLKV